MPAIPRSAASAACPTWRHAAAAPRLSVRGRVVEGGVLMSHRVGREVQALADDVGEDLARLRRLQAAIEVDGGLDALVTQNAPHEFIFAGAVLEDQSARRMAELMHGDAQSGRLLELGRRSGC